MSVYVDPMMVNGTSATWRYTSNCHMFADDVEELHALADTIGLKRAWFQNKPHFPHYDLTESKRRLAVRAGAREVGRDELVSFVQQMRERLRT